MLISVRWSAIQTLVERSLSDVLILLDCCAGAASATFPNGASTTETISASSWDAIAPDPGRYSFTSALIEVLVEWKNRTYSAAMLHAEILARLKHPRPIMHNGRRGFEARSTPVHFMMTSNHRAPSIEMVRVFSPEKTPPSPPAEPKQEMEQEPDSETMTGRSGVPQDVVISEPNEDVPHVMISLALEEDQTLDVNAWESWLAAFPAIAKYVKVQGVFKSHSTLMLLSLPVMVWDLLPNDLACNFIGFIRSNNLAIKSTRPVPTQYITVPTGSEEEARSILSETTASMLTDSIFTGDNSSDAATSIFSKTSYHPESVVGNSRATTGSLAGIGRRKTAPASDFTTSTTSNNISNQMILNQARNSKRNVLVHDESAPNRPDLAQHVQTRLEAYFQDNPAPTVAITEFLASNLGVETTDIDVSFKAVHNFQTSTNTTLAMVRASSRAAASGREIPRSAADRPATRTGGTRRSNDPPRTSQPPA